MTDYLLSFFEPAMLVSILVAVAIFGTFFTFMGSYFEGDSVQKRMKAVMMERERLKTAQIAALANKRDVELRLKGKKQGLAEQLVDLLNLRSLLRGDQARERLRQAGFHSDRYLFIYLSCRILLPIMMAVFAFVYATTVYSEEVPSNVLPIVVLAAAAFGFYLPPVVLTNMIQKRQLSISRAWSDALDLLLICVESGIALEPALLKVSKEIGTQSIALAEELSLTHAELSFLGDRRKALYNLGARTGLPMVRATVTSFIQAERYGTPIGASLRVLAQENRDNRMALAEKKAAALPPKLTVPMILFFLPVIFVVLLGPSIILVLAARG